MGKEVPPYAFMMVEGEVTISEDPQELSRWAHKIARRYMGEELVEEYGERNSIKGELLVRVFPTMIIAWKDMAE